MEQGQARMNSEADGKGDKGQASQWGHGGEGVSQGTIFMTATGLLLMPELKYPRTRVLGGDMIPPPRWRLGRHGEEHKQS